jgi:hypothetical protein
MTGLVVILGTAGAILILVGLVGGGFTFSSYMMPAVGKWIRLPCFAVGAILVILAVGLGINGSSPTSTDNPYPGTIVDPVYAFQGPSLSAVRTAELGTGTSVEIQCTVLGDYVTNPEDGQSENIWDKTSSGYIPDAFVDTGSNNPVMPSC